MASTNFKAMRHLHSSCFRAELGQKRAGASPSSCQESHLLVGQSGRVEETWRS